MTTPISETVSRVVRRLGLATIYMHTKFEVFTESLIYIVYLCTKFDLGGLKI